MTPTLVQMQRKTTKNDHKTLFLSQMQTNAAPVRAARRYKGGREEGKGSGSGTGASGQLEPKHLTGQTVHTLLLPTLVTFR